MIKKPRLDVEGNTKKRKSVPIVTVLEDKKKQLQNYVEHINEDITKPGKASGEKELELEEEVVTIEEAENEEYEEEEEEGEEEEEEEDE